MGTITIILISTRITNRNYKGNAFFQLWSVYSCLLINFHSISILRNSETSDSERKQRLVSEILYRSLFRRLSKKLSSVLVHCYFALAAYTWLDM